MTLHEHLIACFGEEGVEVSQRTTKALRFGLKEIQPGQPLDNGQRIMAEFAEMLGVWELLREHGLVPEIDRDLVLSKKIKVGKFIAYSDSLGMVSHDE